MRTTIIREERGRKPLASALVLLASSVCGFGMLALLLSHDHTRTDRLLAMLPSPFAQSSLAADPELSAQVETRNPRARLTRLADQSTALVVEAEALNTSSLPLARVVMEATLVSEAGPSLKARAECGKVVSETLLNRLSPEAVATLMEIPVATNALAPGHSVSCQMALPGVDSAAHEVEVRIASAEPLPGHSRLRLRPWE